MIAAEIAEALGAAQRSGLWWRCLCPVHGSRTGNSATLALLDGARDLIVHCHAGCSPTDILAEIRRRGLLEGHSDRRVAVSSPFDQHDRAHRIEIARRVWNRGRDAQGTPVVQYLAGRTLNIGPPPCLRWTVQCWHRKARAELPAMLARIDGPNGALIGVHRTYLRRDERGQWHRHDRASLGPIAGGAVRLAPPDETLLIGEGIETCLSAMQATGTPTWSALSTAGLVALVLPSFVHTVVILADHDRNGAGTRAAHAAAARWIGEGRRVRIAMPPEPDSDFNDLLSGRTCARISELSDVGV